MKTLYFWLSLLFSVGIGAQSLQLEGIVKGPDDQPLEMANLVVLSEADSSMVAYGFTDADGQFVLRLPADQRLQLSVSYLGYKAKQIPINTFNKEVLEALQISLEPDQEMLNQVDIVEEMPIVVSGDTISYRADAFNTGQERKLEDVLKNLPGFEVDEDGQVKVEGKTVEKVMIEGQDIFDGDSKVVTKNLPANAVDKVQVLRNYEEISPLQGLSSEDRIALNIKLKEGKKNLWFGDAEAKAGDPERYLVHGNAFYFSPKASFNFIGDINNIGKSAFTVRDYFRFSGGLRNLSRRSGLNLNFASDDLPIPLGQNNRAEEITGRFGAANFNYKVKKDLRLSGFVIANQNVINSPYTTSRTYIGISDSLPNQEELENRNYQNSSVALAKVSATYEPSEGFYLNYDAFGKLSDQRSSSLLASSFGALNNQFLTLENQRPWSFQQNLEFFTNLGEDVLALEVQHLSKFQDPILSLDASANPFPGFTFQDTNAYQLWQERLINSQSLEARASYYWVFNKNNHFEFNLGGNRSTQDFESRILEGLDAAGRDFGDSTSNDLNFSLQDLFAGLHYKTKFGKFTFRPGFNFHRYQVNQNYLSGAQERDFNLFLPDALLRYEISSSQGLDLRYSMEAQFWDVNQVLNGLIIESYNSLFRGNDQLSYATTHNINLNYRNFNLFNFTTIFAGLNYSRTDEGIANQVSFLPSAQGLQQVLSPINANGYNENLVAYGVYSRKFSWVKTDFRANFNYSSLNNQVNGEDNTNNSFGQNYSVGLGTNFEKWPNVELSYALTVNDYSGSRSASTFTNHRPSLEVSAVIWESFTLRADYSYNNYGNQGAASRTSFDFLNASLEYQAQDSPWMFSLEGLNLLNTRFIREDGLSNNLITTTAFTVLPRYLLVGVRYDL